MTVCLMWRWRAAECVQLKLNADPDSTASVESRSFISFILAFSFSYLAPHLWAELSFVPVAAHMWVCVCVWAGEKLSWQRWTTSLYWDDGSIVNDVMYIRGPVRHTHTHTRLQYMLTNAADGRQIKTNKYVHAHMAPRLRFVINNLKRQESLHFRRLICTPITPTHTATPALQTAHIWKERQ